MQGLPPGQTRIGRFIYYSALEPPVVDINAYRLRVAWAGAERSYTYEQLNEMVDVKGVYDFHCVTGWSVTGLEMEGVSMKRLLEGVQGTEGFVLLVGLDGYVATVPLEDALKGFVILRINGAPLTYESGYPARPFFPHLYGWKSSKWLSEIRVVDEYVDGYWEERGYHERGNVWLEERFKDGSFRHQKRSPMRAQERKS